MLGIRVAVFYTELRSRLLAPPSKPTSLRHPKSCAGRCTSHQVSRGLPRMINNLCVQSLVATFAANKAVVDESAARAAVSEVSSE